LLKATFRMLGRILRSMSRWTAVFQQSVHQPPMIQQMKMELNLAGNVTKDRPDPRRENKYTGTGKRPATRCQTCANRGSNDGRSRNERRKTFARAPPLPLPGNRAIRRPSTHRAVEARSARRPKEIIEARGPANCLAPVLVGRQRDSIEQVVQRIGGLFDNGVPIAGGSLD